MTLPVLVAILTGNLLCTSGLAVASSADVTVRVVLGLAEDEAPSPWWLAAIENRHPPEALAKIRETRQPLTGEEKEWLDLFKQQVPLWAKTIPGLAAPFEGVSPPFTVTVLIGNQGGDDGFTHGADVLCCDLSSWVRSYGTASDPANLDRLHRILSHELTHLMTKAWSGLHPPDLSTPLCRALYEMYYEGLGNYYSLSAKWYEPETGLKERSHQVLDELGPKLVDRLLALQEAAPEEEERLREGLSAGPFHEKWGALPVALWLREETGGDPVELRRWIRAGACGVLDLARKHLPTGHGERLQAIRCECASPTEGER